jgi:hypothetical protein
VSITGTPSRANWSETAVFPEAIPPVRTTVKVPGWAVVLAVEALMAAAPQPKPPERA